MISVIVPNYNHAPYLRQRIDSILNQTYQDFELILLDDCSTDNSREIFESYRENPHVTRIVYNETNGGTPFKQWDKGIELAKGEWIWIAESDDWAEPEFLETLMDNIANHPQSGFAYTWTNWVDSSGNKLWNVKETSWVLEYGSFEFIRKKLLLCNSIANVSECIFKKELYRIDQSYRYERMRLCGDWFFYVLLSEQTRVLEIQKVLSNYRQHNSNVSSSAEHKGLTFFEGVNVLEYILDISGLHIKTKEYAKTWGLIFAKYKRQYMIPHDIVKSIVKRFNNHKAIVIWYLMYDLKFKICRK